MQSSIQTIRALECDACGRFDTVMISHDELQARVNTNDLGIGAYSIMHKGHTRIIYFDKDGQYLGDTIAISENDIPENITNKGLPYYIKNKSETSWFKRVRKKLFSRLYNRNLTISIAGPSRAGKTSFVRYIETLIPERESNFINSVPTMGKSQKIIKIGSTTIKSLDMGGQEDFWHLWQPAIEESDAVFFILDATSNNTLEVARAFELLLNYRSNSIPILVLLNKKDLKLRGEVNKFMYPGEFLSLIPSNLDLENVMAIETSIFEGKVYEIDSLEEKSLAETISNFLEEIK